MGIKVDFEAKINWCKAREDGRDMGPGDGGDLDNKIKAMQGQYSCVIVMDDQTKEFLVSKGVTDKGMQAQLWGTTPEGEITYKVKRPHVNPKIIDDETGEPVYYGPPTIISGLGDTNQSWDWEEDGSIGNGSSGKFRLDVYKMKNGGSIVTWDAFKVTDLVEYESNDDFALEDF